MNVSTPGEEVRAWLENLSSEKKPTVETLRRLTGSVSPEAHEIIYHDALGYGPTDSGFFFGGFLHDPEELLLVIVIANFIVVAGWGNYFPWAVLALYAELTGKGNLEPVSYLLVLLTGLAGMAGTYFWWRWADQNR